LSHSPGGVILRLLLALCAIMVLSSTPAQGAVPGQALLRIDLQNPGQLERFVGVPVYAHLFSQSGPGETREEYLLYARDAPDLEQVGRHIRILEKEGKTALVKASHTQAMSLAAPGIEVVRLLLHPLVLPGQLSANWPDTIAPDPAIQAMIDQVSTSTVYSYAAGLSGEFPVMVGGLPYTIQTRNSRTVEPMQKATQYVYEHFAGLGLPTAYYTYTLPGSGPRRNVVAEQSGLSQPERIFLITAHLDSTAGNPSVPESNAPGADDNASGSTGVLVVADILSQYTFDCTLRYALFTGEEQGLLGSLAYAQEVYNNGDAIEAVLNLDMIGYNSDQFPNIELHTRPSNPDDLAIANLFADVVDTYNINLTPQFVPDGISASDHYSFWQRGYPGILAIEDFEDFTPYYHTVNDRVSTLNLTYFTEFAKAVVGTMAYMGCPLGNLSGQVTDVLSGDSIPDVTVTTEDISGQQRSADTSPSGAYQLPLVIGTYTVTAESGGYLPFRTGGIDITMDVTTTLDIQLQPCHILMADFSYMPAEPHTGAPVVFTGTAGITNTLPLSYSWDFGDGHTGIGQAVTHSYTISDTYTVSMSVENCAATSHPVTVTGPPVIQYTAYLPVLLATSQ
jgi:hypothetical protein